MITLLEPAEHPIILERRRQSAVVRHVSGAIGDRTRATIRVLSAKLERRFAAFAGVPYDGPLDLEEWEELWQSETWQSHD